MATHDYVIDNSTGANVRSDLNNVLQAILTNNSSSSAPSTTAAYMWWADTTNGVLKIRNSANDGWVELLQLDGTLTLEDGSASTPGLAFRDDLDTGIYSSADNKFNVATAGTERMELAASGTVFNEDGADVDFRIEGDTQANLFHVDAGNDRVGIRTGSPESVLDVRGIDDQDNFKVEVADTIFAVHTDATTGEISLRAQDGSSNNNAKFMTFHTETASVGASGERMRIDSSGRLLVGTSSARSIFKMGASGNGQTPTFQFETANDDSNNSLSLTYGRNNSSGAEIFIAKHRTATVGGTTVVQSGDRLGGLTFAGSDGTNFQPAALIQAQVDGTPGANDMPGNLTFSTTTDGAIVPTERMRINSTGDVGIENTDPKARLHINSNRNAETDRHDASNYHLVLRNPEDDTGEACGLGFSVTSNATKVGAAILHEREGGGSQGSLQFYTNGDGNSVSERMRITSDGKVGIGLSTPDQLLHVYQQSGSSQAYIHVQNNRSRNAAIKFTTTQGSWLVGQGIGNDNDRFAIYDNQERFVIDSSGKVGIGITSLVAKFSVSENANLVEPMRIDDTNNTDGNRHRISFRTGNSEVGKIVADRSGTTYITSSDYRLKENETIISNGITRLKSLKPYRFNFKIKPEKIVDGFFAHEVGTVVPEAITGTKDEVDSDKNPVYQGIDQSKLVPLLTAALQESISKIEVLETKVAALEAA